MVNSNSSSRRRHFWTLSISIWLTLVLCSVVARRSKDNDKEDNREGKLFSLFNIVHFKNGGCSTTVTLPSGSKRRNGTCYTNNECAQKGGTASGGCAAGFGVCCLFVVTSASAGSISQNCTYIQNPGFPVAYSSTSNVAYTVTKTSSDVCYLRLDFETLALLGTGALVDGTAATSPAYPCLDMFTVTTPSSQKIPVICGENSGAHIFVDMGNAATDSVGLAFTFGTSATLTPSRTWDIKATQYSCSDKNAPPEGCLQYHTGYTGRFTTFNFNAPADNSLPNQQYSVCIRQESGMCCVQYQVCQGYFTATPLSNPAYSLSGSTMPATAAFDSYCSTTESADYIGIADSSSVCNQGLNNVALKSRYCGIFFNDFTSATSNAPICDCTPPFSVEIYTNNLPDKVLTDRSKGVCLEWVQLPCTG